MCGICGHLSHLFEGEIPQADVSQFASFLEGLIPGGTLVATGKALGLSLKHWAIGTSDPFSYCEGILRLRRVPDRKYSRYDGQVVPRIPDYSFVDKLLVHCKEPTLRTDKLLAGTMKLHTCLAPPRRASQAVRDKAYESITSDGPPVPPDLQQHFYDVARRLVSHMRRPKRRRYLTLLAIPANPEKSAHSIVRNKSVRRDSPEHANMRAILAHPFFRELIESFPEETGRCLLTADQGTVQWSHDEIYRLPERDVPLGHITFIPELADKYRIVAVPAEAIFCLNYPLYAVLDSYYNQVPTQGVLSHDKTTEYIRTLIDGHRTFHSFDQSDFTDRFPYALQRELLYAMLDYEHIQPFDMAVQDAIPNIRFTFSKGEVKYKVGTPMGSQASFALASLSHSILVHVCKEIAYGFRFDPIKDPPNARIIGDDLVIWDPPVADVYRRVALELGMKVNDQKTLTSTTVAEMCSKYITANGVFLQKKISSKEPSRSHTIECVKYYGPSYPVREEDLSIMYLPYPWGIRDSDPEFELVKLKKLKERLEGFLPETWTALDTKIQAFRDDPSTRSLFTLVRDGDTRHYTAKSPLLDRAVHDADDILKQCQESTGPEIRDLLDQLCTRVDIVEYIAKHSGYEPESREYGPSVPDPLDGFRKPFSRQDSLDDSVQASPTLLDYLSKERRDHELGL